MKKDTAKNITKSILFSLFALGAVGAIITLPGLALLGKEFTGWKKYKRFRLKSTFKRLEDQKMIKFFEKDDGVIELELTQKGHKRILRYQFEDMKIKIPHKWDGFWRMVSFDIPNNKKQWVVPLLKYYYFFFVSMSFNASFLYSSVSPSSPLSICFLVRSNSDGAA